MCLNLPDKNCRLCPNLAAFLDKNRLLYPDFYNGPVPSFGDLNARMLIVGLAPGLKGANRTGRPFTGDFAGDVMYESLIKHGLAKGIYRARPDDGLVLCNVRITNAVRCVPPQNKVTTEETNTCGNFLINEINAMPHLKIILALGSVAHGAVLKTLKQKKSPFPFGHAKKHLLTFGKRPLTLLDSYHTSRYNINTGVLTPEMFDTVIKNAVTLLEAD